jgi:excinuclease ABC subunit C
MPENHTLIKDLLKSFPATPGIYQFYDIKGHLLYVGKAKNLKKRVQSYFNKLHDTFRLRILVNKIHDIKYIVVGSEQDALLLENNLIKQHQPRYNIQLKDDKTFPWICIKNENFPRVFSTRNRIDDGSLYFGPYTSAFMVKTLLNLIRNIYMLRTCNLVLTQENILSKKFRTCLEYQIENCKGSCEGLQTEADYNESIDQIKKILKGNLGEVSAYLNQLMQNLAAEYKFEEAEKVRIKIGILEKFQTKSTIVNPKISNLDVFAISSNEKFAVVNYLKVVNGAIVQSHTLELKKILDEPDEELMLFGITDIYQKIVSEPGEVLLPFHLSEFSIGYKTTVPKIGDKMKLLELAQRNALQNRIEIERRKETKKENSPELRILGKMKTDLRLNDFPAYIECFDNSNLQGTNAVSACVVFKNAKPSKKEYRHFNIKTVVGPDDYASMKEVIYRRYKRMLDQNSPLPNLIIIDGGKGQLSSAYEVLQELDIHHKIAIIGIAKRLEEIYYPNDPVPLYLDKNTETLKVIQHARNEAHRFGIAHHRSKRGKEMLQSELDSINGIGEKTKKLLFDTFKTVEALKKAPESEVTKVIGQSKTKLLMAYFRKGTMQ